MIVLTAAGVLICTRAFTAVLDVRSSTSLASSILATAGTAEANLALPAVCTAGYLSLPPCPMASTSAFSPFAPSLVRMFN